jgi:hypothetical protein
LEPDVHVCHVIFGQQLRGRTILGCATRRTIRWQGEVFTKKPKGGEAFATSCVVLERERKQKRNEKGLITLSHYYSVRLLMLFCHDPFIFLTALVSISVDTLIGSTCLANGDTGSLDEFLALNLPRYL